MADLTNYIGAPPSPIPLLRRLCFPPSSYLLGHMPPRALRAEQEVQSLLRDIRHGRFERLLAGLTGIGAVITTAEIFFEHDSASFGNKWMWAPIVIGPIAAVAGFAGFASRKAAKTVLPLASVIVVANGFQGTWFHARGIAQKPGGFRNFRYNMEMGPPLLAPLLVTLVGGMGLLAALLRREQ